MRKKAAFAAFSFFLSDSSVFLWEDAQKTASDFYHRAPPCILCSHRICAILSLNQKVKIQIPGSFQEVYAISKCRNFKRSQYKPVSTGNKGGNLEHEETFLGTSSRG
ncbi:MAG: hypothetical protein ACI3XU_02355, partial [Butyricicoccaceae bacterium]